MMRLSIMLKRDFSIYLIRIWLVATCFGMSPEAFSEELLPEQQFTRILQAKTGISNISATYSTSSENEMTRPSHHVVFQSLEQRKCQNTHGSLGNSFDLNYSIQGLNERQFSVYYPNSRLCELIPTEKAEASTWKVRYDLFVNGFIWWPAEKLVPPDDLKVTTFTPIDLLLKIASGASEAPEKTSLTTEENSGRLTLTYQTPRRREKIVLDPSLNYAVLSRELYNVDGTILLCRGIGSLYRELSIGDGNTIQIPLIVDIHATTIGNGSRSYQIRVENIEMNSLSDSDFQLALAPGTILQDRLTGTFSLFTGGKELLNESIDVASKLMPRSTETRGTWNFTYVSWSHLWLVFAACFLSLLFIRKKRTA